MQCVQVEWSPPDEPGGAGMAPTYQLSVSPPTSDCTLLPDGQGYVTVYSGPERSFKVTKLLPGVSYNLCLLVSDAAAAADWTEGAAHSPFSVAPLLDELL